MPIERLLGVTAKIERAKKHILDLDSAIRIFLDDAYVVAAKEKPQIGQTALYIKNAKPIPSDFSMLIGDAVHNLRSALDHLVWQLVEVNGEMPGTQTSFPIYEVLEKTKDKDTAKSLARKIKGVRIPEVFNAIEAVQPYKTGDMTLWHINELDIMDKHQLILTVASCPTHWGLVNGNIWLGQLSGIIFDAKVGDEITNFPTDTYLKNKDNFQFGFDIAFNEPTIIAGQSVLPTLNEMADFVADIVSKFEGFLI